MFDKNRIADKFDVSALPEWAQAEEDVVWLAKINLGYRIKVIDCDPSQEWLTRKAKLVRRGWRLKNPLTEITQL